MSLLCLPKSKRNYCRSTWRCADQILLPRALAHKSVLLGTPDGVVEWGRKAIEVRETAGPAQVGFEDGKIEMCDLKASGLIIGADGVKSVCRQALPAKRCTGFNTSVYLLDFSKPVSTYTVAQLPSATLPLLHHSRMPSRAVYRPTRQL